MTTPRTLPQLKRNLSHLPKISVTVEQVVPHRDANATVRVIVQLLNAGTARVKGFESWVVAVGDANNNIVFRIRL